MPGPDFFIVGAPKCGTTSLDTYLTEHPSIFMAKKEQHFFATDLGDAWHHPAPEEYFRSFAGGRDAQRRGEASGWYLWSRSAASQIHAYNPQAQIIAMLRNPVEMLPSLHSQYLYGGIEDLRDFGEAFAAEADRREGRRIPPKNGSSPWRLFYRDVVRFHEQLERYLDLFGRNQVHVVLFDDLVGAPQKTYRAVLEFLEVDASFLPSFRVMNPNKRVRRPRVKHATSVILDPSSRARRAGTRLIPVHAVRSALLRHGVAALTRLSTDVRPRPPMDPVQRARLAAELAPDIRRLGELLGRDLTHWYASAASSTPDHVR